MGSVGGEPGSSLVQGGTGTEDLTKGTGTRVEGGQGSKGTITAAILKGQMSRVKGAVGVRGDREEGAWRRSTRQGYNNTMRGKGGRERQTAMEE